MTELLDLPTEILLQIIRLLCPHCIISSLNLGLCSCQHIPGQPPASEPPASTQLRQALSRLSQTSRALRAVAQPVLHHAPQPRSHPDGRVPLARTLVRRPDLALGVRELHLGDAGPAGLPPRFRTRETQALFDAVLARFPVDNRGREVRPPDDWFVASDARRMPGIFGDVFAVIDALCLALTTGVEHAHLVHTHQRPEFPFSTPGSLPRLTDLTLESAADGHGIGLDRVQAVLDAAPALLRLRGVKINAASASLSHPTLRSVDLVRSALAAGHLANLMRAFPRLEAFGYDNHGELAPGDEEAGDPRREAKPREIGAALLLRADSLRDVDVDFDRARLYDVARLSAVDAMGSLKEMRALEELAVDRDAIFVSKEMRPDYEWFSDDGADAPGMSEEEDAAALGRRRRKNLLTEFLPPSIRYFKLFDRNGLLFADLLELAAAAPGRFPKLERVRLWGLGEEQRRAVTGAFRAVGVRCYHGGNL